MSSKKLLLTGVEVCKVSNGPNFFPLIDDLWPKREVYVGGPTNPLHLVVRIFNLVVALHMEMGLCICLKLYMLNGHEILNNPQLAPF